MFDDGITYTDMFANLAPCKVSVETCSAMNVRRFCQDHNLRRKVDDNLREIAMATSIIIVTTMITWAQQMYLIYWPGHCHFCDVVINLSFLPGQNWWMVNLCVYNSVYRLKFYNPYRLDCWVEFTSRSWWSCRRLAHSTFLSCFGVQAAHCWGTLMDPPHSSRPTHTELWWTLLKRREKEWVMSRQVLVIFNRHTSTEQSDIYFG